MAGGIFGFDPLQAMLMRVQQQPQAQEQYASGGAAESSTPPPAAPTPTPVAGPSGGGGTGISSLLSSLSGAVGNIASGSGVFGDTSRDAETDPSSGAPLGMVRKSNGQRMMNLGIMLLAAGGRQSDDSRARILASIPGQLGDASSQLNEFAKTRLDMAKTKLIERQMLQEEESNRKLNEYVLGAQGGQAAISAAPASVTPSAVAPVVAAAVPGAIGQAAQAAAGTAPVGTPQPAPAGPAAPGTPAPTGPGTLPVGPPPIQRRIFTPAMLSPAEVQEYLAAKTPEKKTAILAKGQEMLDKQEMTTNPFIDPQTGKIMTHTYQNGVLGKVQSLGDAPGEMKQTLEDGRIVIRKFDARGVPQDIKFEDNPATLEERKFLGAQAAELQKEHRETILPAATSYEKLTPIIQAVKEGKAYTGLTGGIQEYAVNALASFGGASKAQLNSLIETSRVRGVSEEAANRFAKAVNGSQVTDEDRNSARAAIGAVISGNKETLADALERLQEEAARKVRDYQARQQQHIGAIEPRRMAKDVYGAPAVELKAPPPAPPAPPVPGAAPTPNGFDPVAAAAELARRRAAAKR